MGPAVASWRGHVDAPVDALLRRSAPLVLSSLGSWPGAVERQQQQPRNQHQDMDPVRKVFLVRRRPRPSYQLQHHILVLRLCQHLHKHELCCTGAIEGHRMGSKIQGFCQLTELLYMILVRWCLVEWCIADTRRPHPASV